MVPASQEDERGGGEDEEDAEERKLKQDRDEVGGDEVRHDWQGMEASFEGVALRRRTASGEEGRGKTCLPGECIRQPAVWP